MRRFGLTAAVLAAGLLLWSSSVHANETAMSSTTLATSSSGVPTHTGDVPSSNSFFINALAVGSQQLPSGEFSSGAIRRSSPAGATLFLWFPTPTPEPGTMLLFGSGLLLICIIVRRKQVRAKEGNIGLIDAA